MWLFRLNSDIDARTKQGWFRPPVEIYSRGEHILSKQKLKSSDLASLLENMRFRKREAGQTIYPNDYAISSINQCKDFLKESFMDSFADCVFLRTPTSEIGPMRDSHLFVIVFSELGLVSKIYTADNSGPTAEGETESAAENESDVHFSEVELASLPPKLFAQFYSSEPILKNIIHVGDAPLECLQAVTAIEDSQFLEHKGISLTGLMRAFARNIVSGHYAQGGSTITQQLIKNYFLTPEKTLKRKISELMMAVLLETKMDKDQILENYLNVVYMGQRGPFQVIGLSSASDYYFNKPLKDLNLSECSLLAAMINSPGRYNPFQHPEHALKRRDLVLDRMVETGMTTPENALRAKSSILPKELKLRMVEPAPYFTQAIFREIERLGIDTSNGLRVFSSLDVVAQDLAQRKVLEHVQNLEKNYKNIASLKAQNKNIEASLISVDIASGEVLALVGGRQYVKTQYNRVLDAHRQVGSIMKPFVFLTALESRDAAGERYSPLTMIDDAPFEYKYEGQKWSPQNYEKKFHGPIPIFYALKNSINVATAKVGTQIGLSNIVDVAMRAGVTSHIDPYPSLTLGAFEIYPWEVARAILTIARMGMSAPLVFIQSLEDLNGKAIYKNEVSASRVFSQESTAVLIGMLKQTLDTGTARYARTLGYTQPAAGKTGTTSDTKDTWFAGFTPFNLTLTWTGYDDNTPSGLTGASGALPLWVEFMKNYSDKFPTDDFKWPDTVEKFSLSKDEFLKLVPNAASFELQDSTVLIREK